ncbi:MAG: lipopolysaccharide heptosyltransferase II [Gammaproteobacteria bacterium]|nr:lipopolysaccharide heptosyltransferase II [Gammaproteobacteria bacterium]
MNNKILIVGPAWVGDMVMAQSLFKLLKQRHPQLLIDVLAPAWSLPLLERMPEVTIGIVMPLGHGQLDLKVRYNLGKSLRAAQYDQAIVLPNSFKSALIPYWANIPRRTGWRGEARWLVLNDLRKLNKKQYPLMIEQFMALGLSDGEALPADYPLPELISTAKTQDSVLAKYQMQRHERPVLALCPGAEFGPAKRWPENYYAQVANAKIAEGWDIWLLGSPKDAVVSESIMQETQQKCINFTGRTSLVEAVDLLSLSSAVVSNDSGLMHIAAAVRKPLVALYGPTSPAFTPPLHKQAKILQLSLDCQPCFQRECPLVHHRCMRELHPQQVLTALSEMTCVF